MNKIINFHDVNKIEWFESVIKILKAKYEFISAEEIGLFLGRNKTLKNTCHVTVDDGDISFYEIIYPVLKKYKIPATIFVSPEAIVKRKNFWFQEIRGFGNNELRSIIASFIGINEERIMNYPVSHLMKMLRISEIWQIIEIYGKKFTNGQKECQNMTVDQLFEIEREGLVAIGAHTLTHPILSNENDDICENEILGSIRQLEELLNHKIDYFAYPNGVPEIDFGDREIQILCSADIKLAFSTETKNLNINDNPQMIPRFGISHGNQIFVQAKLFIGEYWNLFRNIKKKSEKKTRKELKSIIGR